MIVLGLLFILVALGATGFALTAPSAAAQTIEVTALGFTVSASPLAMFLAGAISLALLGLGYALISGGARRKARSRKELRQLRKEQAAAGVSPSAEGSHRSSRRDHSAQEGTTEASAERSKESGKESGKDLPSQERTESDPPSHS